MADNYGHFITHKQKKEVEFRILWPDATDRWIRLWVYPIMVEDKMHYAAGIAQDDSETKKNFFHMEKINAKKNVTLEILSQDLKGPIGNIQRLASLIEKRISAFQDQEITEWVKLIVQICQRSIDLIRNFVNVEFLESANIVMNKERLDLVWELGIIIETYKKSQKDIAKVFEFTSSQSEVYAAIDSMKFLQVINNLLSNAIKFTHDNGLIHLHIKKKQGTTGRAAKVLITVRDNGIGIPASYQPFLFDKFTKARRPGVRGEESVGLGMYIIKTIVEWHNGSIWFESEDNKGTTFYIEISEA